MTSKPTTLSTPTFMVQDKDAMFPAIPYAIRTEDGRLFRRFGTCLKAFDWLTKNGYRYSTSACLYVR